MTLGELINKTDNETIIEVWDEQKSLKANTKNLHRGQV